AAIAQIEAINPHLNAVVHTRFEKVQKELEHMNTSLPLAGLPILLKDNTQGIAGEKLTQGSKLFQNYRPKHDSEYVSRLKKAGAVSLGFTNVPEFSLLGITEPKAYGPTRN